MMSTWPNRGASGGAPRRAGRPLRGASRRPLFVENLMIN